MSDSGSAEDRRVERSYHSNGLVAAEATYLGEHIEGVTKRWYDNGVLQSEIPVRKSRTHGIVRTWDRIGNLLDESEFVDGTGIGRSFHDNGVMAGEICMKDSIPHGYQRCWDETGGLTAELFYVSGRKVSRKRYEQARKDDPSLPEPPAKKLAPIARPTAREGGQGLRAAKDEKDLHELLGAGPHAEALEWLRENNRTLGEGLAGEEAIALIEKLYQAGATEVIAAEIDKDTDGDENTGKLIVKLPDDGGRRKKTIRMCNSLNADVGLEAERDIGQRFTIVVLD